MIEKIITAEELQMSLLNWTNRGFEKILDKILKSFPDLYEMF